ncbi:MULTISPECIES: SGNH/GDSL hydrolase family protein [Francisella]|uniref:SGNH/GDSL hydrolase family protein n=1 Tax=Francisella TaxID=262 RepID=UPI0011B7FB5A|nr:MULTISPECIES: SGNH/GDSL hydrolase family protein [Francisella]
MKKYFLSTITLLTISSSAFADARSNLVLENNCSVPVYFTVNSDNTTGQNIKSKKIDTNTYQDIGEYINNSINPFSYTSNLKITYSLSPDEESINEAIIDYRLINGYKTNEANFNITGNATVNNQINNLLHTWHSYSPIFSYKIPTYTITACPIETKLNLKSPLNGIDRILIFGDSLSDQGNLYTYTGGIIPKSKPYYNGMFSNGPTWANLLTKKLSYLQKPIAVSSYAVGGATAILNPKWVEQGLPYNLGGEIEIYKKVDTDAHDTDRNLAIIFIGGNDYLSISDSEDMTKIHYIAKEVTDKIISSIDEINAQKTILIGIPNLSLVPESEIRGNQKQLAEVSRLHNKYLEDFARGKSNVVFISINDMFEKLFTNTAEFNQEFNTKINADKVGETCWKGGYFLPSPRDFDSKEFYNSLIMSNSDLLRSNGGEDEAFDIDKIPLNSDITSAILGAETGQMCDNPEEFIFWDNVHPTQQVQKALFEHISKVLDMEISTSV